MERWEGLSILEVRQEPEVGQEEYRGSVGGRKTGEEQRRWVEDGGGGGPTTGHDTLVDQIHTQLAKATSLGGGRPAHVTNGRPLRY